MFFPVDKFFRLKTCILIAVLFARIKELGYEGDVSQAPRSDTSDTPCIHTADNVLR